MKPHSSYLAVNPRLEGKPNSLLRRQLLRSAAASLASAAILPSISLAAPNTTSASAASKNPNLEAGAGKGNVLIGLDAEFGLENSLSAQAVELGLKVAIAEINGNGGVLGGRQLELISKDHRSMPARGIRNLIDFAAMPNLVAVFGARFSPVIIEQLPKIKELKLPFMAVWSSADPIVQNNMQPNYVFRLSLRDSLAMPKMLASAKQRHLKKVGLLLTNTAWGRSNEAAAQRYVASTPGSKIVGTAWYNWKDNSLIGQYNKLKAAGAQAIVLVANDDEAAVLVREIAALPVEQRLPIFSHWGISGGEFVKQAGPALREVDLSVIQTFSFFSADKSILANFMKTLAEITPLREIDEIRAPVGVAHAYDLMHILAKAIDLAGTTEREEIRSAMEKIRNHRGLIKIYAPPFSASNHEALGADELLMARYRIDGVLVPAQK